MNIGPKSLALVVVMALLQGCTAGAPQYAESAYTPPVATTAAQGDAVKDAQRPAAPLEKGRTDVTGVWRGKSSAECGMLIPDETRCGAVNDITLTLLQQGAKVSGFYKCD